MGISLRKRLDGLLQRPIHRHAVAVAGEADIVVAVEAVAASDADAAASCRAVRAIGPQAASTVRLRMKKKDLKRIYYLAESSSFFGILEPRT